MQNVNEKNNLAYVYKHVFVFNSDYVSLTKRVVEKSANKFEERNGSSEKKRITQIFVNIIEKNFEFIIMRDILQESNRQESLDIEFTSFNNVNINDNPYHIC